MQNSRDGLGRLSTTRESLDRENEERERKWVETKGKGVTGSESDI